MVQAILRLDAPPAPHHAADALAVAICHAMAPPLLRRRDDRPPAGQRRRADARQRRARRERRRLSRPDDAARAAQGAGRGEVTLETYLHVREDALQLYGFAEPAERELFEQLLSVSGVGPKVALAIVSGSTPADLRRAIALEDATRFVAIPGIGKKTAERIVLELKEKLGALEVGELRASRNWWRATHWSSSATRVVRRSRRWRRPIPTCQPEERVRRALRRRHEAPQFLAPTLRPEEDELERSLRPRRSTSSSARSASRSSSRSRSRRRGRAARRSTTCCSSARRARQDEPRVHRPRRARRRHPHRRRPGARAQGRPRGDPDRARGRDVLFVDEIHRLNRAVEEMLYPALEDFRLDIVVGQGPAARTLTLDVPPFTLIGATTRTGLLTTPLRDRFGMTFRLDYYEPDELAAIVNRSAGILGVEIGDDAADEIARRSRGTPRVANRILRRVRDVAEVRHEGVVTPAIAARGARAARGRRLRARADRPRAAARDRRAFDGGPVGLSTLAVALGEGRTRRGRLRAVPAPARLHPAHDRGAGSSPTSGAQHLGAPMGDCLEPLLGPPPVRVSAQEASSSDVVQMLRPNVAANSVFVPAWYWMSVTGTRGKFGPTLSQIRRRSG